MRRSFALPALALAVTLLVLLVQLAAGGTDYAPTRAADPCRERPLGPTAVDLEQLTEAVVLIGVQRAACTLGVTRERLVLALPAAAGRRRIAQESGRGERGVLLALRRGLDGAVLRLDRAGRMPRASVLRDSYAGELGLPGLAEEAIRRIPDGIVDGLLPTGKVLRRALGRLDLAGVLKDIEAPGRLEARLRADIEAAARDEARAQLVQRIPAPIRGLLGLG